MFRAPASMVEPHRVTVLRAAGRLRAAARARLSASRHRLADARARFEAHRPAIRQAAARERLRSLDARLRSAVRRSVSDLRGQLASADRQLRLLGPGETLARGWSLTFDAGGALVRRVDDAAPGSVLVTKLADGAVRSRVEGDSAPATLFGPSGG